jgi:cyclase
MILSSDVEVIDLSVPVDPNFWEPTPVVRDVILHAQGADLLGRGQALGKSWLYRVMVWVKQHLGFGVDHRDFPDGKGLSLMHYTLSTHTGTHMDAPFHYGDVTREGAPSKTISDLPLTWCYRPGVLIDVSGGAPNEIIEVDEIKAALAKTRTTLCPLDIVLLYTGSDRALGTPHYFTQYRGITREAVAWLVLQGIKIIGMDSFSFDPPFPHMIAEYKRTRDPRCLWPAHFYGREQEYCQLERLTNLATLKKFSSFKVSAFPVKLEGADASWCRVVAIIE